ncbi:GNAT family N-acetyltransferase [Roseibium sp. HPY-6]|uniref:GNAT family N-acetyltransferase n=1 Tax=Roseibium sp. HPY-6 TaxID=3229852 RepID=UPI0033906B66
MRIEPVQQYEIRKANRGDMPACGRILNDWIDETPWMPRVNSHEDVVRHHCEFVFENRTVFIADVLKTVTGFAATSSDGFVTGLYLAKDARGKGIGRSLLERLKEENPDGLKLWTFVANARGRKFYEREGFNEVRRTSGENEEKLPDILFAWRPECKDPDHGSDGSLTRKHSVDAV